jgi:hypothetical protein
VDAEGYSLVLVKKDKDRFMLAQDKDRFLLAQNGDHFLCLGSHNILTERGANILTERGGIYTHMP